MNTDLFDVDQRIIVLTGGMGQLGRQFTRALVERGARVAIFDAACTDERGRARFGELERNPSVAFYNVDVTRRAAIERALDAVAAAWGTPHALINNAALDVPPNAPAEENGSYESYPERSWDRILEVNVKGVHHCCQIVGGVMAAAGRGSIVNISSIYGLLSPNQGLYEFRRRDGATFFKPVAYSVSKAAILNLTRYLATYWASRGVRVNTLTFGGVYNRQPEEFLKSYCAHVPMGRMAREDEYNGAVVFLVSDASSYMTGSNIVIDGGWTAW